MNNGENYKVTIETFKGMKPEDRDWIIYDTLGSHTVRINKLEKSQKTNTIASGIGGVFGGVLIWAVNLLTNKG